MCRTCAGLINLLPLAVWKEMLYVPILKFHYHLYQYVYLEIPHSMAREFMILEYVSVTGKESSFYKRVY